MDGEQESIAEPELETPAIEPEIEAEEPVNLDEGEEPEVEAAPEEDDSEEFDWNGQKIRGPKGLKDGVLMHADYTRKTQDLSSRGRELDERATRLDQQFQASEEYLDARADLRAVTKELDRYKDWGWAEYQAMRLSDPMGADEHWNYRQHLEAQKNNLTASIKQHDDTRSSEAQQEIAKRMNETQQFAQKLKGWTADTDKQVIDFALSKGATPQDITRLMNPLVYEMIYLARIGAQTLNKPASAAKPAPTQPAPLKVVAAKANPPSRKSFSEMSMEEYAAARQAGRGS